MATHYVTAKCAVCENAVRIGSNTRKARLCKACREARYIANLASIMSKSGEPYERMIAAQRRRRERG